MKKELKGINRIGIGHKLIYCEIKTNKNRGLEEFCKDYIFPNYSNSLVLDKPSEEEIQIIKNPSGVADIYSLKTLRGKTIFIVSEFDNGYIDYTIKYFNDWKINSNKNSEELNELYINMCESAKNIETKLN